MTRATGRCVSCGRTVPAVDGPSGYYLAAHGCALPAGHPELELTDRDEQGLRDLDDGLTLDDDLLSRFVDVRYVRFRRRRGELPAPELTPQGRERLRYLNARDHHR